MKGFIGSSWNVYQGEGKLRKEVIVLGAILLIAGIAYAFVDSYEVMVDEGWGHWEPDPLYPNNVPPAHIWVQDDPAIYETRYPNMTVGAIVALIGIVASIIGGYMPNQTSDTVSLASH
jgi:hypothetical protein